MCLVNPTDQGTTELTKHMRDVLDIIPAGASWNQTVTFLKTKAEPKLKDTLKNPDIAKPILEIIMAFYERFKDPRNAGSHEGDKTEFHLNAGSSNIYISPREFEDMYAIVCHNLDPKISRFKKKAREEDDPNVIEKMAHALKHDVFEAVKQKLSFIIEDKHGVRSEEFWQDLEEWFMTAPEADKLDLVSKKAKTLSFEDIAERAYSDQGTVLAQNTELINYLQNNDPGAFKQDLREFLFKRAAKSKAFLLDATHFLRELQPNGTITHAKDAKGKEAKTSHLEHFLREIVHAIYIHKLSKEFLAPLKEVMRELLGTDEIGTELVGEIGAINGRLAKYIRNLKVD